MHELSIAINIVEIATHEAKQAEAAKVSRLDIEVGALSGVITDALEFAMQEAVKDTIMEHARVNIIEIPAKARCRSCRHEFPVDDWFTDCPKCRSPENDLIKGRELRLKSLEVS